MLLETVLRAGGHSTTRTEKGAAAVVSRKYSATTMADKNAAKVLFQSMHNLQKN